MTGRTHDLAAFTALTFIVVSNPLPKIILATALVGFAANMIGGVGPDIDQPTGKLWGDIGLKYNLSGLFTPLLGGHRHLSHSLVGLLLFGFLSKIVLVFLSGIIVFDPNIAWWAFMIGFFSHLVMDTFTEEGVPWLFPIHIKFGIPPVHFLRIKTGGWAESFGVFPLLLLLNVYMFYANYHLVLTFIKHYIN